jgi:hypothetical protein
MTAPLDGSNEQLQQEATAFLAHEQETYNKRSDGFFSYLRDNGQKLSPVQYQIYRDNHLYRTLGVLPALAQALEKAAWLGDHQTVSDLGKTIYEECGETRTPHLRLLEDAFNLHGKTVFDLSPITMQEAEHSSYLLKEAIAFRNVQKEIFTHGSYPAILAATYVREAAAQLMLKNFYESLFLPYCEYYQQSGVDFSPVSKFFLGHIEGVEDEHADHALRDALCACRSENDLAAFKDGAAKLLEAQANLWEALRHWMIEHAATS